MGLSLNLPFVVIPKEPTKQVICCKIVINYGLEASDKRENIFYKPLNQWNNLQDLEEQGGNVLF